MIKRTILSAVVFCVVLTPPASRADVQRVASNDGAVLYMSLAPELSYSDTTTYRGLSATPASGKTAVRNRRMLGRVWSTVMPPRFPSTKRWTAGIVII